MSAKPNLDHLRFVYKKATEDWIDSIRDEEDAATADSSVTALDEWNAAHFREHDAHLKAAAAREAYKDALRTLNFGF
jgi:hypothetical protein